MIGHFDGDCNGEIYGWALDPSDPERPLRIIVCVDGLPVCEALAIHHRPDVGAAFSCRGLNGFYVDLAKVAPGRRGEISILLPDGQHVANSPTTLEIPARPCRYEPYVLFMHIPKTAGTSIREAIVESYLTSELAYLYPHPPGLPCGDLRCLPLEQRSRFRCVIGHFKFGVHCGLPRPSRYMTVVREPISRVISHYRHLASTLPELVSENGEILPICDAIEHQITLELDNLMVRYIAGVDDSEFPAGSLTEEHLKLAVANLRSHFALVGFQDRAQAAFDRGAALFGWKQRDVEERMVGSSTIPLGDQDQIEKTIRHFNQWDLKLYQEILQRF